MSVLPGAAPRLSIAPAIGPELRARRPTGPLPVPLMRTASAGNRAAAGASSRSRAGAWAPPSEWDRLWPTAARRRALGRRVVGRLIVQRPLDVGGRGRPAVERIAPAPVQQCHGRSTADMLLPHLVVAVQRGQGARGARGHDVAAHAVDAQGGAGGDDSLQLPLAQPDARQADACRGDACRERFLRSPPVGGEPLRVALEREAPPHDLGAQRGLARPAHLDAEPEAIQQLRPQLPLLHVHRADEEEAGSVHGRDRVPLHAGDARRGRVQQRVDEMVGQQVDLVDVEDALMGARQQPCLERPLAGQRAAEVERPDQPVQARAERELDERRRARLDGGVRRHGAVRRELPGPEREGLAAGGRDGREQRREPAHGGRLRRAALAAHEHAADLGRDGVGEQRLDQLLLADDRGERVRDAHAPASSSSPSSAR